ncbi:MAG: CxxC-x17-CxxC domain-containing protein, partial [Patescibacteria group bacterium]
LDYPSSTMLGIMRMLADKNYRKKVVDTIQDPVVKAFWVNEFANYNERFRSEAISPIQNKVGQFLSSSIIRNIVAQPKSTIDMKDIMDNGKILLINVSKGRIGEDNSALLGAMLITKLQLAAMDRAVIAEEDRRDFYLYVDEFQNFATESFATILSEARKYRLNLIIAHQYITQMEEVVRDAVFGNVGTIISFRIGAFDAEYMEKEFEPYFMQTDLVNLDKYNAYVKLMINGVTSAPFSMETIPPVHETYNSKEKVLAVSRERYGNRREDIEEKIARWSGVAFQGAAEESDKESVSPPYQGGAGGGAPRNQTSPNPSFQNKPSEFQQRRQQQVDEYQRKQQPTFAQPAGGSSAGKQKQRPAFNSITGEAITDTPKPVSPKPFDTGQNKPSNIHKPNNSPTYASQNREATAGKAELEDVVIAPPTNEVITDLAGLLGKKEVEKSKPSPTLFDAICSNCGKETQVPFKPDPEKEVFCKECYEKIKLEKSTIKPKEAPAVNKTPQVAQDAPVIPKPKPVFTPPRPPKL